MTPEILNEMFYVLDHQDPLDATFWAVSLLMFFLLLCKSNAVADTLWSADPNKLICREDIEWLQGSVLVTLRWSKTNQFGEHLVFSLPQIKTSNLCPISALKNMWGLVPGNLRYLFQVTRWSAFYVLSVSFKTSILFEKTGV